MSYGPDDVLWKLVSQAGVEPASPGFRPGARPPELPTRYELRLVRRTRTDPICVTGRYAANTTAPAQPCMPEAGLEPAMPMNPARGSQPRVSAFAPLGRNVCERRDSNPHQPVIGQPSCRWTTRANGTRRNARLAARSRTSRPVDRPGPSPESARRTLEPFFFLWSGWPVLPRRPLGPEPSALLAAPHPEKLVVHGTTFEVSGWQESNLRRLGPRPSAPPLSHIQMNWRPTRESNPTCRFCRAVRSQNGWPNLVASRERPGSADGSSALGVDGRPARPFDVTPPRGSAAPALAGMAIVAPDEGIEPSSAARQAAILATERIGRSTP